MKLPADGAGVRLRCWPRRFGCVLRGEDVETALEVVGDGSEKDLGGGTGEAPPSHPTQSIAALPGSEDLLDAGTHPMDRGVPGTQSRKRLPLVPPPHRDGHDARRAALRPNCIAEIRAAISTVREHVARIIGNGLWPGATVIHIGR